MVGIVLGRMHSWLHWTTAHGLVTKFTNHSVKCIRSLQPSQAWRIEPTRSISGQPWRDHPSIKLFIRSLFSTTLYWYFFMFFFSSLCTFARHHHLQRDDVIALTATVRQVTTCRRTLENGIWSARFMLATWAHQLRSKSSKEYLTNTEPWETSGLLVIHQALLSLNLRTQEMLKMLSAHLMERKLSYTWVNIAKIILTVAFQSYLRNQNSSRDVIRTTRRADEGRRGGGGGPRRDDRGGGRGRHRFETQSCLIVTNTKYLYFPEISWEVFVRKIKNRNQKEMKSC